MRVDAGPQMTQAQLRVVEAPADGTLVVIGPAGSGKTTALAARAAALSVDRPVMAICSHDASRDAFRDALGDFDAADVIVDTLDGHLARLMRGRFAACGAAADLVVGTEADSVALVRSASHDVLDMTWPGLTADGFTLDLPLLGRPDSFFEEAAALFRQLRRSRVDPDSFDSGCAAGSTEFYGADVERALASCAEAGIRSRASKRGRDALSANAETLRVQKKAERDLAALLAHMYQAYCRAARGAGILCPEDLIDEGLRWLGADSRATGEIATEIAAIVIDDAEDSEPGAADLLELFVRSGVPSVTIAGWGGATIDGIGGRKNIMPDRHAFQIDLPPAAWSASRKSAKRFVDEEAEADHLASRLAELLAQGVPPRDIVVASRDVDAATVYAAALSARGIPAVAPSARWQAPHDIADLLAVAAVVDDPHDHAHLLRVLASPLVGLSDASLRTLCLDPAGSAQLVLDVAAGDDRASRPRGSGESTLSGNVLTGSADHLLDENSRLSLAAFRSRWAHWRAACIGIDPAAALALLVDGAGFRAAWHAAPAHLRARLADDARRLIAAAAKAAVRQSGSRLAAVVNALENGSTAARPARESTDAIACKTIVELKGRRAAYVFVAGVAHERFPRIYVSHPLAFSRRYGLIARENVAGTAAQSAKFAWYYANFGAKARFLEEERRALDYGLARARIEAFATGFARPPRWAAEQDLLARHGA